MAGLSRLFLSLGLDCAPRYLVHGHDLAGFSGRLLCRFLVKDRPSHCEAQETRLYSQPAQEARCRSYLNLRSRARNPRLLTYTVRKSADCCCRAPTVPLFQGSRTGRSRSTVHLRIFANHEAFSLPCTSTKI